MRAMRILVAAIFATIIPQICFAASITVSQAGADPGTVMKGEYFTVTVSDLSSSGSVALSLPSGFSTSESVSKSYGEGTTSVTWTTIIADQKLTGQVIRATITVAGSPTVVESSSFDVVLPPSFVASSSPSSISVSNLQGIYYANITFNVQNWGETVAKDVVATISYPSGMSLVSGYDAIQSIGTIGGGPGGTGESKGTSWKLSAGSAVSGNIYITLTSSNADSSIITIPVSLSFAASTTTTTTSEETPASGGQNPSTTTTLPTKTQFWSSMTKGVPYLVSGFGSEMGITLINITMKNSVSNAMLVVNKLASKPSFVQAVPNCTVYSYIEIIAANLAENDISSANIRFDVPKWWITANNIDKSRIRLYRYSNGSWQRLYTSLLSETNMTITYEATTPGFSIFAIAVERFSTTTTAGSQAITSGETATTTTTQMETAYGEPYTNFEWIVVILFLIAFVIAYLKRKTIEKISNKMRRKEHKYSFHPK